MQTATVALPALAPRAAAVRRGRGRAPLCARAAANRGKPPAPRDDTVQYGNNWYEQTKRLSKRKSTAETLGASRGACSQRHSLSPAAARSFRARAPRTAASSHLRGAARAFQRSTSSQTSG